MNAPHSAGGSKLGYLYQSRYALLRALIDGKQNPALAISIEKFDDVAFEQDQKPLELIQTKHHCTPADTSDKSVDVWKTLNIWIEFVGADPATAADTKFLFLTTQTAAEDSALSFLRTHKESRDIKKVTELLIAAAKSSKNQKTDKARKSFLALDDAQRNLLLENIWVFDDAPNISGVRQEIEDALFYSAPEGKIEHFVDYLEGWWFNRVILSLTGESSDAIPVQSIQSKIYEIIENFKSGKLPLDDDIDAMPPVTTLPDDERVLVKQMRLVDISENVALAAVHDYYRASAQRSRWARENLLLDGEAERYDRTLHDAWRRRFLASCEDAGDDDVKKTDFGKKTFRWACEYAKPLRNRDEIWLSSGSFQILADNLRVGWHPDYEQLLSSEDTKK